MKKLSYWIFVIFVALLAMAASSCTKETKEDDPPEVKKPKIPLMLVNQVILNGQKHQMIRIGVRFQATGLHEWNYIDLSEGYQTPGGIYTKHYAGNLPLDEYGKHEIQIFFADGGAGYWKDFMFTQDKEVFIRAWSNANNNGWFIEMDGIPAQTKYEFQ